MTKLRLTEIPNPKPIKLTVELSPEVFRDLSDYAEILSRASDNKHEPIQLVSPMLEKFMHGDRAFRRLRKSLKNNGKST